MVDATPDCVTAFDGVESLPRQHFILMIYGERWIDWAHVRPSDAHTLPDSALIAIIHYFDICIDAAALRH